MATGKATALSNALLDTVLGGATYTPVGTTAIALFTAAPGAGGTSPSPVEVTNANSYARVSLTNNATNWPNASAGLKSNGTTITFTAATGSWGTIVAFGIYDSATYGAGNLLYFGNLSTAKTVGNTDVVSFAVGTLQITES